VEPLRLPCDTNPGHPVTAPGPDHLLCERVGACGAFSLCSEITKGKKTETVTLQINLPEASLQELMVWCAGLLCEIRAMAPAPAVGGNPSPEAIPAEEDVLEEKALEQLAAQAGQAGLPVCSQCGEGQFPEAVVHFAGRHFCGQMCLQKHVEDAQAVAAYSEVKAAGKAPPAEVCHRSEPCCSRPGQRDRRAANQCLEDCSCHD
jgi:hypothetical protein